MSFKEFLGYKPKKAIVTEWFAGNDELRFFEDLAKRQTTLAGGANNYGIIIDDTIKTQARTNLMELMKLHGYKMKKWGDSGSKTGSSGTDTRIFIPVETDGPVVSGVKLYVKFVNNPQSKNMILYISVVHMANMSKREAVNDFGFKNTSIFQS